nr:MAG TPA: hypothetical protein [Caudoviricetes sp.]
MSCKPSLALWGSYIHKSATKACHRCVAPCSKREKCELSAIVVPSCRLHTEKRMFTQRCENLPLMRTEKDICPCVYI